MRTAILSADAGWHVRELQRALEARGHTVDVLPVDGLVGELGGARRLASAGNLLDDRDIVFVRTIPRGSLEQIIFRMDALHALERTGCLVVNPPSSIERTVDKFYASSLLEEAGLPTPRTVVAEREADALAAFRTFGDVVVKPLFGANGRGMVRITDEEVAYRVFRALDLERAVYYIQETLPHPGRDVRAFVVGDVVVAAMWRSADGWRTNVARGGRAEPVRLDTSWERLAVCAARAVGTVYAGVDLLPTESGEIFVLEVNGIPGWRGLRRATGVDVASAIVRHAEALASARAAARATPAGTTVTGVTQRS